ERFLAEGSVVAPAPVLGLITLQHRHQVIANAPCMPWPWWNLQWNSVLPLPGTVTLTSIDWPGFNVWSTLRAGDVKVWAVEPSFFSSRVSLAPPGASMKVGL